MADSLAKLAEDMRVFDEPEAKEWAARLDALAAQNVPESAFCFNAALSQNQRWNLAGKQPYRFHPSASHVTPGWRDGWNNALDAVCEYGFIEPSAELAASSGNVRRES